MDITVALSREALFAALAVLTDKARETRGHILALEARGQYLEADVTRAEARPLLEAMSRITEASAAARPLRSVGAPASNVVPLPAAAL